MSSHGYARSDGVVAEQAPREPLEWAVATRCRRGEATTGDLAVFARLPNGALIAAIDGVGHGDEAAHAALKAGAILRERPSHDLVLLAERCPLHDAPEGLARAYERRRWARVPKREHDDARHAARRRPGPGDGWDRRRVRGLARHLWLGPGDRRADRCRPLEAHGRCPGGG